MQGAKRTGARGRAKIAALAALLLAAALPDAGRADTAELQQALQRRMSMNDESLASQQRVEELSDEVEDLLTRYRAALRHVESLRTYNGQLDELVSSQREEMAVLRDELERIELVSRDVTPLMLRMIEALEQFVALDVPFLVEERTHRIRDIRAMMRRADVSEAEKFQRIMEAYQIENEYGRTIEAYRALLAREGREQTVDFLRVGRIALMYQTLDGSEAGYWNPRTRAWQPLGGRHRQAIRSGLQIARKQTAPDMIRVPLPPAEAAEGAR